MSVCHMAFICSNSLLNRCSLICLGLQKILYKDLGWSIQWWHVGPAVCLLLHDDLMFSKVHEGYAIHACLGKHWPCHLEVSIFPMAGLMLWQILAMKCLQNRT